MVPIFDEHVIGAATLTTRGLRAGGALHLAIVLEHGMQLATRDRLLAQVAGEYGVVVH